MGLTSSKLGSREMAIICRQLATAYKAGLHILAALDITAGQGASPRGRRALLHMEALIKGGASLADACRAEEKVFPGLFVQVVSAGESGGRLDALLRDLAEHYEEMYKMKRAAVGALIYPGLQLVAAWFMGTFALGIIRRVTNVFNSSHAQFSLSDYFAEYIHFQAIVLILVALAAGVFIVLARAGLMEGPVTVLKNRLWPLNRVTRKFAMARFFRGMALLLQAGLDIKQCVMRSAAMTMNKTIENDLLTALPVIARGGDLVEAFSRCRYLDRVGREMLAIGEQSGDLEDTLQKAAEYSMSEAQSEVKIASKILQVLITLAVGCVVGYFVISFYSNLYSIR